MVLLQSLEVGMGYAPFLFLLAAFAAVPLARGADKPLTQSAASAAGAIVVDLYTTKMGAYSNPEDPAHPGVFYELVTELSRRSGVAVRVKDLPWSRALKMVVKDRAPALLFPLIRTAQRESEYSWPIRALNDRLVLFGLAGAPKPAGLEKFRPYRIGVIRGSPFERQLKSLSFANLDVANDAIDNAKKLKAKRIDYWYVTFNTASYTFEQLGFPSDTFDVAHTVARSGVYIGANRSLPADLAARLQKAFAEVVANGWYTKLLAKYKVVDAGD